MGPIDVGLSSDGCIPRCDVGEPRGEEVTWPEESVQKKKIRNKKIRTQHENQRMQRQFLETRSSRVLPLWDL